MPNVIVILHTSGKWVPSGTICGTISECWGTDLSKNQKLLAFSENLIVLIRSNEQLTRIYDHQPRHALAAPNQNKIVKFETVTLYLFLDLFCLC